MTCTVSLLESLKILFQYKVFDYIDDEIQKTRTI